MKEYDKYLKLLKEKYPTKQSVYRELINLNAIMNLPKGKIPRKSPPWS